jgi:endonuclease/exonuclease/phosphatase family metal-dependent hydrolase
VIKTLTIFLSVIAAFTMIVASFSVYVSPNIFVWISFLGLGFPVILLINFVILFLGAATLNKTSVIISIIAFAITWNDVISTINISIPSKSDDEITLITWNIKNLDLYDWTKNPETKQKMFELLEENKPDILCLQEFYTDNNKHKNLEELKKRLGFKYIHFEETFTLKDGNRRWGLITLSKFPIVNTGKITFEEGLKLNACIYSDIEIKGDTVRIYNLHFQSIQFDEDDYEYLENVRSSPYLNNSSVKIIGKIRTGFKKRALQANKVYEHLAVYDGKKVIVCGDFNDTSVSFAYNLLAKNMQDSFSKKGLGFGKTFVNSTPFLKIDHVLMHKDFIINSHQVLKKPYSDHYAVKVGFE